MFGFETTSGGSVSVFSLAVLDRLGLSVSFVSFLVYLMRRPQEEEVDQLASSDFSAPQAPKNRVFRPKNRVFRRPKKWGFDSIGKNLVISDSRTPNPPGGWGGVLRNLGFKGFFEIYFGFKRKVRKSVGI